MIYYIFKPESGRARLLTQDKGGAKLPKRRTGEWVSDGQLEIVHGGTTPMGASSDDVMAGIERDGYFLWLEPDPPAPMPELKK